MLLHLVHHLDQISSNASLANILAQADQPPIETDSPLVEHHKGKVKCIGDALKECHASYHHLFQGKPVMCDLNQSLLEMLDQIRLGFDTAPVAREAKGRKAKPRRQHLPPIESTPLLNESERAHLGKADCTRPTHAPDDLADPIENEDDGDDDEYETQSELEHADSSPPQRRRRTDIDFDTLSSTSCERNDMEDTSTPLNEDMDIVDGDKVVPLVADSSSGLELQALVASPGAGRSDSH